MSTVMVTKQCWTTVHMPTWVYTTARMPTISVSVVMHRTVLVRMEPQLVFSWLVQVVSLKVKHLIILKDV
jgi:hypothetical protein